MHGRLAQLLLDGFNNDEVIQLENALKALTQRVISTYPERLNADLHDLNQLEGVRLDIQNITKDCNDSTIIARSIHTLLDAIDRFGTPQFARHARCAFIAKSICKSLVTEGYISSDKYNHFISSIKTIAVDYDRDYHAVLDGRMTREQFFVIYGHLRAGTYDIRSPRYDQMDHLFSGQQEYKEKGPYINDALNEEVGSVLEKAMKNDGLDNLTGNEIVSFIKLATEEREYFKFIFTKSLSFAIELIRRIGIISGIEARDLSYLELPEIYAAEYYSDIDRLHEFWSLIVSKRREIYRTSSEMILPSVICSELDFRCIESITARPNFITESKVTGEVINLRDETEESIDGKIVVIEKADPGFDWIFSKGIAGLITKYGGAASHMAIRCAEFRIPAAIGSGATLFEYASKSKRLTIDCKHEKLMRVE